MNLKTEADNVAAGVEYAALATVLTVTVVAAVAVVGVARALRRRTNQEHPAGSRDNQRR